MRKISAHLIVDGKGRCYSKGILTLAPDGTILDIMDTAGQLEESAEVEFFSGMIVPGFVNAHCHLELSHLLHAFQEGEGLVPFLKSVVDKRAIEMNAIVAAAEKADLLMYKEGIIAVGDIANGVNVHEVKSRSKIDYFTFIEALGFSPERAETAFKWAKTGRKRAEDLGLKSSIVPHAPYSVSTALFNCIAEEALQTGAILSIHSQESSEEDELYLSGSGALMNHLKDNLAIDTSFFVPSGVDAIRSTLEYLPKQNNLLLVHNLFTNQEDIDYITKVRDLNNTWFVLCIGSNKYIQDRLPDIELFRQNKLQICLGTDSLASNHQLSILEEMKIVQSHFPSPSLEELIGWACYQGAKALQIEEWAGSIEIGKRPGINLLTGLDLVERRLLPGTKVRKLC